jgi:hypothetical protein
MALTPGDRIDLKRRISQTLSQQEWNVVDLTLDEFGCSTEEDWRGGTDAYIVAMLRGCSDEVLTQLDRYLHPSASAPVEPQPATFDDPTNPWIGAGLRLFLSHVHPYAEHVGEIRKSLARRSIDAFVAHDAIEPTEDWKQVILNALGSCDACMAFLTPDFSASVWCDQEVGFCIARNRLVIPVDYGQTPYGFLGDFQSLKVKKGQDADDIALAVFELLLRKSQTRELMAQALVRRWVSTGSFDEARENYGLLRRIPKDVWTQAAVDDVWEARERNSELRHANINWRDSVDALDALFNDLPFKRPAPGSGSS